MNILELKVQMVNETVEILVNIIKNDKFANY